MSKDNFDPSTAIYTPAQVADIGLRAVRQTHEDAKAGVGIGIPIPGICDYFKPVLPGQICGIIAQTSNFKTSFMEFIETETAKTLDQAGCENKILVHISVEELIEDQAYLQLAMHSGDDAGNLAQGDVLDWNVLETAAVRIGAIPIYRIGSSMARAEDMPNLYMSNMILAIKYLKEKLLDWKVEIAGLFFDYLQAFPIDPEYKTANQEQQRRLQVRADVFRLKQAAAYFRCPVFVSIQAKQKLDGANPPLMIPGIYDGEETSAIGQRFNRMITLWMPKMTHTVGSTIEGRGYNFNVRENQLWVKIAKQQGRLPSGRAWMCEIDFATNQITLPNTQNFATRTVNLNDYTK